MKATNIQVFCVYLCLILGAVTVKCKPSSENSYTLDGLDYIEPVEVKIKQLVNLNANPRSNSPVKVISHSTFGYLFPDRDEFYSKKIKSLPDSETSENSVLQNTIRDNPPPWDQVAKMARYIVKNSNWTSMATTSSRQPTLGFPFVNVVSVSDGPVGKSTGIPYFYITPLDMSVIDLQKDPRASLSMSLAQGNYCSDSTYDPEDPRCAKLILTGNVVKVANGTKEEDFARQSVFSKHPAMKTWPADHGFFFAKLNIKYITVLDYFGGAQNVDVKEYYRTKLF